MDIGIVAKKTGLKPSTLRYYEKIGLIQSNGRNGLRRTYSKNVMKKLQLIILLKNNYFSLNDIKKMLDRGDIDRQYLLEKEKELQRKIIELSAVCETLQHIARCPQKNHFDCVSFQKLLG